MAGKSKAYAPHVILRQKLMAGERVESLAKSLGDFLAQTIFRGSDLPMDAAKRKADVALFIDSVGLNDITETPVFSAPYFDAKRNHHTNRLDGIAARLRSDTDLKVGAHHLKAKFANNTETLLHGDGPDYQTWILETIEGVWRSFSTEFSRFWPSERSGMLYENAVFAGQPLAAEQALSHRLTMIREDSLGFAGVEMIRRTLSLAHIAENDRIEDEALRAKCEARGLELGRHLVVNRARIGNTTQVNDLAKQINKGTAS